MLRGMRPVSAKEHLIHRIAINKNIPTAAVCWLNDRMVFVRIGKKPFSRASSATPFGGLRRRSRVLPVHRETDGEPTPTGENERSVPLLDGACKLGER